MSKKIKQIDTPAPGPIVDDPLIETIQVEPAPADIAALAAALDEAQDRGTEPPLSQMDAPEVLPPVQTARIRVYGTDFPDEAREIAVSFKHGERVESGARVHFVDFEVPTAQVNAFYALIDRA